MSIQKVGLQIVGIGPLIMHNIQLANPLNKYSKALKKLTGKRQKTEADILELARLEWEGGLYLHEGEVVMPGVNIYAGLIMGGKKSKRGVKIKSGTNIREDFCPLSYEGQKIKVANNGEIPNSELDKFYTLYNFQSMVVVQGKRLLRTRPCFQKWSFGCTVDFDDNVIEEDEIIKVAEDAGLLVGLGDWRPRYGRFMVEKIN